MNEDGRIALYVPSLRGGGAERVFVNLARAFAAGGLKVDLVLAKAEGPYLSEVPPEVRIVDLEAPRVIFSFPGLVRYLRRERPRAMLSTLSHANIVALWARKMAGVTVRLVIREANTVGISAENSPSFRGKVMPILVRLFYRWADAVIANSVGSAENLIQITGLPRNRVQVIYNPVVRPELFQKAKEPLGHPWFQSAQPPVILGVGRLTEQKDFPTLIRAFSLVTTVRSARLMILGEGEDRSKLEALVRELGLEDVVALPGFVQNPYQFMKRARLFVLSSRWEGSPNGLIEALALGRSVVSTDCPSGPAEVLEGGKWGRLVPVGDVPTLAQAILSSLDEEMVPGVPDRVQHFSLEQTVATYLSLLDVPRRPDGL